MGAWRLKKGTKRQVCSTRKKQEMYTDTHMQSQIVWGFQHVGLHKPYDEENLEVLNGK